MHCLLQRVAVAQQGPAGVWNVMLFAMIHLSVPSANFTNGRLLGPSVQSLHCADRPGVGGHCTPGGI